MLNFYCKPACLYCRRVLQANERINAPLILKDIQQDAAALMELLEKTRGQRTPFLEDTDRGVSLYESIDIIDHLARHYAGRVDAVGS